MSGDVGRLRSWLQAVADVAAAANTAIEIPELLDLVAGTVTRLTGFEFCAVVLSSESGTSLTIVGASGLAPDYVDQVNLDLSIHIDDGHPMSSGPTTRAFRTGRPVAIPDVTIDETFMPWRLAAEQQGYRSLLCVPIVTGGTVLGVLNAYGLQPRPVPPEEIGLVETLASHAAIALTTARLRDAERRALAALERRGDALERAQQLNQRLLDTAVADEPLPQLVSAVHDAIARPTRLRRDDRSDVVVGAFTGDEELLGADIVLLDDVIGQLQAVAGGADDDVVQRMIESAAWVVSLVVLGQLHVEEVETRDAADLMRALVTCRDDDRPALRRRAQRLGHDLDVPHVVAVFRPVGLLGDHTPESHNRSLLQAVHTSVPRSTPEAMVVASDGDVVLLLPAAGRTDEQLHGIIRRCYQAASQRLQQRAVHCVVTRTVDDLFEANAAIRSAVSVVSLRVEASSAAQVTVLNEHGIMLSLLQSRYPTDLVAYARSTLGAVVGTARSTDLLDTLDAYLASDGSLNDAARAVHVHPNTVLYRLGRIETLTGINMRTPDARLNARLALMIHRLLGE